MPDPITALIIGASSVLTSLSFGVGQRAAAKLMPTKAELSQIALQKHTIENNILTLEQRERHHRENLDEQRERLWLQMELAAENEQKARLLAHALQKWPFHTTVGGLLRVSRDRKGRCLNIIITRRLDNLDPSTGKLKAQATSGAATTSTQPLIDLLRTMVRLSDRDASSLLGSRVRIYDETQYATQSNASGLTTNMYELLATEPCALLLIEPTSSSTVRIDISMWGLGFQAGDVLAANSAVALNLQNLTQKDMGLVAYYSLMNLIVGLSDAYQVTHFPHRLDTPVFPHAMVAARESNLPVNAWTNMLAAYISALDNVSTHSPLVASALAAKTAHQLCELGIDEFAMSVIERGAAYFQQTTSAHPPPLLAEMHLRLKGSPLPGVDENSRSDTHADLMTRHARLFASYDPQNSRRDT